MHANFTCEVVCVSSALIPVAQQALEILEGAASDFRFHLAGMPQVISEGGGRTPRLAPWTSTELSALLSAERTARKCARLIGVLEEPLENNWFSNTAYGRDVAWITTHNWEFYSHLPVASFVAYDLVLNGVLMQAVKRPQEEAWLMNEVVHAHETRGCISDLCVFKPDISLKIQSGFICPDCQRIFAQRLGSATLEAVQGLLKRISETCKPTEPGTSIHDFPALERMRDRLEKTKGSAKAKLGCRTDYLTKNLKDLAAQSESLSEHERQLIKELEQVRAHRTQLADQAAQLQKEVEVAHREQEVLYSRSESFLAVPANGSKQVGGLGRPGLHDEVERRYPFPIAYCFRSLRAELNPTDRWLALYELYTLIDRKSVV